MRYGIQHFRFYFLETSSAALRWFLSPSPCDTGLLADLYDSLDSQSNSTNCNNCAGLICARTSRLLLNLQSPERAKIQAQILFVSRIAQKPLQLRIGATGTDCLQQKVGASMPSTRHCLARHLGKNVCCIDLGFSSECTSQHHTHTHTQTQTTYQDIQSGMHHSCVPTAPALSRLYRVCHAQHPLHRCSCSCRRFVPMRAGVAKTRRSYWIAHTLWMRA